MSNAKERMKNAVEFKKWESIIALFFISYDEQIEDNSMMTFTVNMHLYETVKDDRYDMSYITDMIFRHSDIEKIQKLNQILPIAPKDTFRYMFQRKDDCIEIKTLYIISCHEKDLLWRVHRERGGLGRIIDEASKMKNDYHNEIAIIYSVRIRSLDYTKNLFNSLEIACRTRRNNRDSRHHTERTKDKKM
jgi:hypothetical protein